MIFCKKISLVLVAALAAGVAFARNVGPTYGGLVDAVEFRARDGIGNVMKKIRSGQPVRVAYFGGSITAMDGWRRLSREWLQKRYSHCAFSEIQASIGGTGSGLGVYRCGMDVVKHCPDLVFVEFATNDRNVPVDEVWQNFDGIVRQIWRSNPAADIVFAYTIVADMMKEYGAGKCPRVTSAMEKLAEYYGIPSICFGVRVAENVKSGRMVMSIGEAETAVPVETPERDKMIIAELAQKGKILFAKDGVHPMLPGHKFYLESIKAAWMAMENSKPINHSGRLVAPFFSASMESAKMIPISGEMLLGKWGQVAANDVNGNYASYFGGKLWLTKVPGSKLRFRFKGSKCMIYDLLGPACGQLWVNVDGKCGAKPMPRFDGYCTYYRLATLPVYSGKEGMHEVEIELDGDQPSRQSVAFRLKDPKTELASAKYNGTEWFAGCIMLVGELDVLKSR